MWLTLSSSRSHMSYLRSRAKLLLKKKKYQEQLLERTDAQLENLEKMTQDIEFAQVETQVRG